MIQVDLITGFLGSGKTTFIKKYVDYLYRQHLHVAVIENDYGAINVDRMLLSEALEGKADVEMVIGGDKDCRIRRFKTKLIAMGMQGYDRVIVEPSGIYDVDEFFDVLHEAPLDQWYEIGNVIAVVNSKLEDLSPQADYVLASEAVYAGKVILSRVDEATEEDIQHTLNHLQMALKAHHSQRDIKKDVIKKRWDAYRDADFEEIMHSGYQLGIFYKQFIDDNYFRSLFFLNIHFSLATLQERIKQIFNDHELGRVMRIKGFVCENQQWYEVNATADDLSVEAIHDGQEVIIVIGEQLDEEKIHHYLK
ncbi:MAG: GTP-binding protein [Sharpea porci]|uniref:GTP-binding protein n=1 Tax=Sharpea porci TaxID=2652286 RepID=UPI002409C1D6|nr:GTP-binding protein [Sharpea porci]MDD6712035.1 GTP-binding protein [Sharpea porci]